MSGKLLVTGSGGLVGSEAALYYLQKGWQVYGLENNMRSYFFGENGDVSGNISQLTSWEKYHHLDMDVRDREGTSQIFLRNGPFDLVIHAAAQPSHDWSKKEPFIDFDINAVGTLNLLENFRLHSPAGVFIFTSTNKVYGDRPNLARLVESELRYDFDWQQEIAGVSVNGVSELMSIDQSTHSLFGASKVAADVLAQEYGQYFDLNVGIFRGGCLTGSRHSAVELHGFLAYLVTCGIEKKHYTIFGYKGKQVRDQIHSSDVIAAFDEFYKNPRKGKTYNIGGGKENSTSILEVIKMLKLDFGIRVKYSLINKNRVGDHVCYYTDLSRFKNDYPDWKIKMSLKQIVKDIIEKKIKYKSLPPKVGEENN